MSFAQLKKNRGSSLEKLVKEAEKLKGNSYEEDTKNLWTPTVDKAGNGYAVIRFLPEPNGEDTPFVRLFNHGFQGPGGWFIENCPTTLGGECPVCKVNSGYWNSGVDSDKEVARKQKRKLSYYSNILVLKDPANPDNEGKVFLFRYGKKIWDKIAEATDPQFEDETPFNPFDFWEGADFKLKIRQVEGYKNYDKSEFETPSELYDGNEDALEKVYSQLNPLAEIIAPEKFKKYAELEAKMKRVLGGESRGSKTYHQEVEEEDIPFEKVAQGKSIPSAIHDDDDMSFFEKLAAD